MTEYCNQYSLACAMKDIILLFLCSKCVIIFVKMNLCHWWHGLVVMLFCVSKLLNIRPGYYWDG